MSSSVIAEVSMEAKIGSGFGRDEPASVSFEIAVGDGESDNEVDGLSFSFVAMTG
jgi:hypothetical protein